VLNTGAVNISFMQTISKSVPLPVLFFLFPFVKKYGKISAETFLKEKPYENHQ